MLKNIADASVGFYNRPRTDSNGDELNPCFLSAAQVPADAPTTVRRAWGAGNANFNALGVAAAAPIYYNYSVSNTSPQGTGMGTDSAAGICDAVDDTPAVADASTPDVIPVVAIGDLDGDAELSVFERNLGTDDSRRPLVSGLIITNELE